MNGSGSILSSDGKCGILPISFGKNKQLKVILFYKICKFPFTLSKPKIKCSVDDWANEVSFLSLVLCLPNVFCNSLSQLPTASAVPPCGTHGFPDLSCFPLADAVHSSPWLWVLIKALLDHPVLYLPFFCFSCYLDKVSMCCGVDLHELCLHSSIGALILVSLLFSLWFSFLKISLCSSDTRSSFVEVGQRYLRERETERKWLKKVLVFLSSDIFLKYFYFIHSGVKVAVVRFSPFSYLKQTSSSISQDNIFCLPCYLMNYKLY